MTARVTRRPSPEERAARLLADERDDARAHRRAVGRTLLACLGWAVVGLGGMAWGMHSADPRRAGAAFWAGLLLGDVGLFVTLVRAYQRSEE